MDPIGSINPRTDTTLLMGVEAIQRGYKVFTYEPKHLILNNEDILAIARPTALRIDPESYYAVGKPQQINLRDMDVVLMRQDPPFNMEYITATYLLERLKPDTLVVNDPFHVRNAPEKLFMFDFPQFVPPTIITRDIEIIEKFLKTHKHVVIKPVYGYAGQAIFSVKQGDPNLHSLLEVFFSNSPEPVIIQRFLPEIKTMDKRIIVIDGDVTAIMGRVPAEGDIRANMRVGGTGIKVKHNKHDMLIGETVGKELKKRGILLAGLDVIGEYLTEINVTCPTGLVRSNQLYNLKQESMFWDAVEKRL